MSDVRTPERGMGRRLLLVLGLAAVVTAVVVAAMLGVFSGGGTGAGTVTPSNQTAAGVGATPPPVAIVNEVVADGIAVPVRAAELAVAAAGTVADVPVALGDTVAAAAVLVELDTAPIDLEIAGARAAVDAAAARVAQAVAQRTQADEQVAVALAGLEQAAAALATARDNNVREDEAVAARDAARAQVRVARAAATAAADGVTVAEADVRRAEAGVASLELARDGLTIRAPFAGTVAALAVQEGSRVSPGQVLVRLADESAWEFVATELDESGIAGIRPGGEATITLDAIPGVIIPGTVARIGAYGESRQGGVVYEVVVVPVGEVPDAVRWNMTTTIALKVGG
ncbi:MAG TPA: HlyD family efflux transporter periplasmic adaptor subunit [Candidatus Limnocylindrales bacterium]|nr:HlyD family efflux transporter periplasmic adaptor subunit [Candidatus Limnocylindrales bacterium]